MTEISSADRFLEESMKKLKWHGIAFSLLIFFIYIMGTYDFFMMLSHNEADKSGHKARIECGGKIGYTGAANKWANWNLMEAYT